MRITLLHITLAVVCCTNPVFAKKKKSTRKEVFSPEKELAGFTVPDGFVVELVASEADGIINPIDLAFDDAGRIWTQTARMYPLDPIGGMSRKNREFVMSNKEHQDKNPEFQRIRDLYQSKTKGTDEILILSNIYNNQPLQVKKFATGLAIPQSILPYKNGAYVAQGSELFFLEDTNQDGVSDKRTPVLTGFGFTDTHTMSHCLVRSPGGWVTFSQGALNMGNITAVKSGESTRIDYSKVARFSLDGNHIELVSAGLNNIWGLKLRANGQWYITEANDGGHGVTPADPFSFYPGIGNAKLRDYQPQTPSMHDFRIGGTGISGIAFCDDLKGEFAEKYKDVAFVANPITSKINNAKVIRNADGTVTATQLPDFLVSTDDWFRPVHIDFGPDGNLYIVDWYNKIVSHNEVRNNHPDRDKAHGRIWRVRPKNAAERNVPNLYTVATSQLIKHLKSPYMWERKAAWQQIADRQAKELIPQLKTLAADTSAHVNYRIPALWSLESLGEIDEALMTNLAKDKDADMRREALRALVTLDVAPEFLASVLTNIGSEPHVFVRSQALRSIEQLGKTNPALVNIAVSFCQPAAEDNELGAGYDINFERYLARRALEKYPQELKTYLETSAAKQQPSDHIFWARQALGTQSVASVLKQWKTLRQKPLNKETLVFISGLDGSKEVRKSLAPYFSDPKKAMNIANVALENVADAYSAQTADILGETVETLIKSKNPEEFALGLKLAKAYRITSISKHIAGILPRTKNEAVRGQIITALSYEPKPFAAQFKAVMDDTSSGLRIKALSAYVQALEGKALQDVQAFITSNADSKSSIINALGNTAQGNVMLLKLVEEKTFSADDISNTISDRIQYLSPKDPTAKEIAKVCAKRRAAEHKAAKDRIPQVEAFIVKNPGNTASGKAIFAGMCLTCHVVGTEGAGIGPALDGSAERDLNHLLTAVLMPDEATEGGYALYRIIEKSGQITEGMKMKDGDRGTIIGHQGGRFSFVPAPSISKQSDVGSKSFMPSDQFDKLPDSVLADIVAYIKTLN